MSRWLAVLGMLATLAVAWGLDRWIDAYRRRMAQEFINIPSLVWAYGLANLLVAGALFALAWPVVRGGSIDRPVALVYLIVGGFLALFPALHFTPGLEFLITPETGPLRMALLGERFVTRFSLASAFVAAAGLVGLILSYRQRAGEPDAAAGDAGRKFASNRE